MSALPPSSTPDRQPGTPRWVKVVYVLCAVVTVLIVALLLFGGGDHGPGRHTSLGNDAGRTVQPSVVDEHGADNGIPQS